MTEARLRLGVYDAAVDEIDKVREHRAPGGTHQPRIETAIDVRHDLRDRAIAGAQTVDDLCANVGRRCCCQGKHGWVAQFFNHTAQG